MVNKISLWGGIAAVIYLGFVGALFAYVSNCSGMFCEAGILLAVLPWFSLFDAASLPVSGHTLFWALVILDSLILYLLFAVLERWTKRAR